jgi:hypothetical protein
LIFLVLASSGTLASRRLGKSEPRHGLAAVHLADPFVVGLAFWSAIRRARRSPQACSNP